MKIETKRLLLRPLCDNDAHAIAQALNNYEVAKNLARVAFPYKLEAAQDFITMQRNFDPRSVVCAIAFRAAPDELLGIASYEVDDSVCEFGYWLRQCCWHMGIMSEAAKALVEVSFSDAKLAALHSSFHIDNPHSGKILEKLGFVETHQEMNYSLAQSQYVSTSKVKLTRESWAAK